MSDSSPKSGSKVVTSQQRIGKNHIVAQIFNNRIKMVEGPPGNPKTVISLVCWKTTTQWLVS